MKKKLSILSIVLLLSLIVIVPAAAITWGEPDDGEHPNVGTLLFRQNGIGYYSCTGTMIAPTVMLTAGHCVEEFGNVNDVTYVRFEENAMAGYQDVIDEIITLQEWFDRDWLAVDTVIPHPLYDDYAEFPMTYDMGVVILSEAVAPSNGFATLPEERFLETLKGQDKSHFVVVGYGQQSTLPPFYQNDYERYKGVVRLLEVNSMLSGKTSSSARFSNNPGIGGGTCYGDSGGPTFYKDTNMIVTVTSFGWAKNGNCVGNDFNFRVDLPTSLDFLNGILAGR